VEEIVEEKFVNEKLHAAIGELSPEEQKIIYEIFFERKSETELAETLGITQQAVSKRKKKVLAKLKEKINF